MSEILEANPTLPAYVQVPVSIELMCIFYNSNTDSLAHAKTRIAFLIEEIKEEVANTLKIKFRTMPPAELASIEGQQVIENLKSQLISFRKALKLQTEEGGTNICEFQQTDSQNIWTISYILMPNGDIHKIYRDSKDASFNIEVILDTQDNLHLPTLAPGQSFSIDSI